MEKKYVLISTILEARNALILISGSNQGYVLVQAKSAEIKEIDLGNVSIEIGIKTYSNVSYNILTPHCQLGFSLSHVYNPLFVGPDYKIPKSRADVFDSLNNDRAADDKGLVFGNVIPEAYDD